MATEEESPVVVKCAVCGKPLTDPNSVVRGIGPVCLPRIAKVLAGEEALEGEGRVSEERLKEIIVLAKEGKPPKQDALPMDGDRPYITVARMHEYCVDHDVPPGRMVRAIGGDRAIGPALNPKWQPIYFGRSRYIHPDCMTGEGLKELEVFAVRIVKEDKEPKAPRVIKEPKVQEAKAARAPRGARKAAAEEDLETVDVEEIA